MRLGTDRCEFSQLRRLVSELYSKVNIRSLVAQTANCVSPYPSRSEARRVQYCRISVLILTPER